MTSSTGLTVELGIPLAGCHHPLENPNKHQLSENQWPLAP